MGFMPLKICYVLPLLLLAACESAPPVGEVPASVVEPEFTKGESWTYQLRDGYNGLPLRTYREEIGAVGQDHLSVRLTDGRQSTTTDETYTGAGNPVDVRPGRAALAIHYTPFYPAYVFPLQVGSRWKQALLVKYQGTGPAIRATLHAQVDGWERVRVPAGEFDALKIQRQIYLDDEEFWRWGTTVLETDWYVPAIKRFVRHEDKSEFIEKSGRFPNNLRRGDWTIVELQQYRPAE